MRSITDYDDNEAALRDSTKYRDIDPVTTAYIRNQDLFAPQTMEQVRMHAGGTCLVTAYVRNRELFAPKMIKQARMHAGGMCMAISTFANARMPRHN